jgi:DNA-binding response OmpR family regulator
MRDLVGETLPDADFQVTCYESGKAAFETIRAEPMKYAAVSDFQLLGTAALTCCARSNKSGRICQ